MVRIVNKRETETELAHKDVYLNDRYIGYIIRAIKHPAVAIKNLNWHFVSDTMGVPHMVGKTKKELIDKISKLKNQ